MLEGNLRWFFLHNLHCECNGEITCVICFEEEGGLRTELFCGHNFHKECIEEWFRRNYECPFCPMCKRDFRKHRQYARFDRYYQERLTSKYSIIDEFRYFSREI